MAFSRDGWQPIGGQSKRGDAPGVWSYKSADGVATVNNSGYFNDVSTDVSVGDMIIVFDSNTPAMSLMVVVSNTSGVVDCSNGTSVDVTAGD